jgi:hypothetical protein
MKDFKEKYQKIVLFMENGEGQSTAEHLMTKTTLPFADKVLKFPLPDKFKNREWTNMMEVEILLTMWKDSGHILHSMEPLMKLPAEPSL